jgi:hypothetical protein
MHAKRTQSWTFVGAVRQRACVLGQRKGGGRRSATAAPAASWQSVQPHQDPTHDEITGGGAGAGAGAAAGGGGGGVLVVLVVVAMLVLVLVLPAVGVGAGR